MLAWIIQHIVKRKTGLINNIQTPTSTKFSNCNSILKRIYFHKYLYTCVYIYTDLFIFTFTKSKPNQIPTYKPVLENLQYYFMLSCRDDRFISPKRGAQSPVSIYKNDSLLTKRQAYICKSLKIEPVELHHCQKHHPHSHKTMLNSLQTLFPIYKLRLPITDWCQRVLKI